MTDAFSPFDAYRYEDPAHTRRFQRRPQQRFDRVKFTLCALELLPLPATRVAVFPSHRLEVSQGLDLARGREARWVMLGIPRDASARSIALALTQIVAECEGSHALAAMLGFAERVGRAN
jgi:hypothetical protein